MKTQPVTALQIGRAIEQIAPRETGVSTDELGFLVGDPDTPVRGVGCMWIAHSSSIQKAVDLGLNVLVVHEHVFCEPQEHNWYQGPTRWEEIVCNQKRQALLKKHELVVYRSHSNWDALPVDGVPDQAVEALGLGPMKTLPGQKFFKVHELPVPMTVEELTERVRVGLDLSWKPRVFGNREKIIKRMAFLIGGFGANQLHIPQVAAACGAQALIIGEMKEVVVMNALESGLPVIETLHSSSEIPAIKRQTQMLQERFPDLNIQYIDSGALAF